MHKACRSVADANAALLPVVCSLHVFDVGGRLVASASMHTEDRSPAFFGARVMVAVPSAAAVDEALSFLWMLEVGSCFNVVVGTQLLFEDFQPSTLEKQRAVETFLAELDFAAASPTDCGRVAQAAAGQGRCGLAATVLFAQNEQECREVCRAGLGGVGTNAPLFPVRTALAAAEHTAYQHLAQVRWVAAANTARWPDEPSFECAPRTTVTIGGGPECQRKHVVVEIPSATPRGVLLCAELHSEGALVSTTLPALVPEARPTGAPLSAAQLHALHLLETQQCCCPCYA